MTKAPRRPRDGRTWSFKLDANLAAMLAYAGFFLFSGVAFLLFEKQDRYVRFHAAQSVLVAVTLAVLYVFLGSVPLLSLLVPVLWTASVVLWLFLMLRAYRGEAYKLPLLGSLAQLLAGR